MWFKRMFLAALLAASLWAAPTGSIKGYVRDATGAVIPNASVTLVNDNTGVQQKSVSDSAGLYQFLDLNPGKYTVSATVQGFRTTQVKDLTLLVDQVVSLDLKLELGDVSQAVEVSGSVELLQTENASTGTNVTAEMTASLPLANRQFTDLAVLTPGVSFAAAGSQASRTSAPGSASRPWWPSSPRERRSPPIWSISSANTGRRSS